MRSAGMCPGCEPPAPPAQWAGLWAPNLGDMLQGCPHVRADMGSLAHKYPGTDTQILNKSQSMLDNGDSLKGVSIFPLKFVCPVWLLPGAAVRNLHRPGGGRGSLDHPRLRARCRQGLTRRPSSRGPHVPRLAVTAPGLHCQGHMATPFVLLSISQLCSYKHLSLNSGHPNPCNLIKRLNLITPAKIPFPNRVPFTGM